MHVVDYNEHGRKIKKTCTDINGKIAYETEYLYEQNKLVEKRMYNDRYGFEYKLQATEYFEYPDKTTILKTVKLSNGIISHYILYFLHNEDIVAAKFLNPEKGQVRWRVEYSESMEMGIELMDDVLLPYTFKEILDYVMKVSNHKYLYIKETQTDTDMYADELNLISNQYRENHEMHVQFVF